MPDLSRELIETLESTLSGYLIGRGCSEIAFVDAGGSAAVFKAVVNQEIRAFKVFDPRLFSSVDSKEHHRLELQRRLIGHSCPFLVQTYKTELFEDTAIIEMEFVQWPQLKEILSNIPDEAIAKLIKQLVAAVEFLESLDIVHRDIKPENIHVSSDFQNLKLLDLGVAREFNPAPDIEETDHGQLRPFMATAQYSSPEYLFRLDPPSEELWRGLNIYQVGAVLHDMITKQPIFNAEMLTGNRWTLAKAVLTKTPTFATSARADLDAMKSLASRCLSKDLEFRLKIASLSDFQALESTNSANVLQRKIAIKQGGSKIAELERTLKFQRQRYQEDLYNSLRDKLIPTTTTAIPFKLVAHETPNKTELRFVIEERIAFTHISLFYKWNDDIHSHTAEVYIAAGLFLAEDNINEQELKTVALCSIDINEQNDIHTQTAYNKIAELLVAAIDRLELVKQQPSETKYEKDLQA